MDRHRIVPRRFSRWWRRLSGRGIGSIAMTPDEYIKEFRSLLYRMSKEGFINKPDKFVAVNDIELAVHKLQQAFDRDISDK
jgi:hypothetical protein